MYNFHGRSGIEREIVRNQSEDFQPQDWTFGTRFASYIHRLEAAKVVISKKSPDLEAKVGQLLTAAEISWSLRDKASSEAFSSLIDSIRFMHLALLQSPAQACSNALILRLALDLARALNHMHLLSPSLVHLDVKTMNVLLVSPHPDPYSSAPIIKLTDFGSARPYSPSSLSHLCKASNIDITPRWAAPEVVQDFFHPHSDCWSWALVVWEICSREIPFDIMQGSMNEAMISQAIQDGIRPVIPPSVPEELAEILSGCWNANV
ncbi:MAG: protein kinase, partial [archaeon]|nr:protein kinase [archaeon]